jgi:hypothetical protein
MNDDSTRQSVLFSDLSSKPVVAKFDHEQASSDGGAILLQACDRQLALTEALIGWIDDRRQSGKIRHAIGDLVRQRLYAIACGYPDGNDAGRLGADPIQKLLCGRDAVRGEDLASQPTLSRFENAFDRADLYRMSVALAETVIERHRRRLKRKVKRITIDLDPTDDPTHGAQQLTFFNGHYDTWCCLPVAGLTPRLAEWTRRDSRRNPVLEIRNPPTIASENRSSALVLVVKSPPRRPAPAAT